LRFYFVFFSLDERYGDFSPTIKLERQKSPGALAFQGLGVGVAMTRSLHHEYRLLTLLSRKQRCVEAVCRNQGITLTFPAQAR
jgi:hypothetical protein